jgi:molecular chaperone DnaK (HSP70)
LDNSEIDFQKDNEKPLKKVLVFDLGGTSLDITLLYVRNGLIEFKAKGGDARLVN